MLEWLVGIHYDWSVPVGSPGKGLKKQLPPHIWALVEQTYAGAQLADNWQALARTMALFRQVAVQVGQHLVQQPINSHQVLTSTLPRVEPHRLLFTDY